jgi:regulator of sigma E protease
LEYALGWTVVILKVLIGLGFVIFVHELGHFAVAKFCGVKCEKFYLGFDIAGLKLYRRRWGETEYGIGILPLGGYVKMLGQEDNPAKLREEMERAKQKGEEGRGNGEERGPGTSVPGKEGSGLKVQGSDENPELAALFDPRSYLAKSVPKRMAIIAAGVIMNVIFAFLMAVVAFWMGVPQTPCIVGGVMPGDPAWQVGLRPGDEILEIAGKKMKQFRDLQTAIILGNIDVGEGVPILVQRPDEHGKLGTPFEVSVKPDRSRGAFFIGVANQYTTRLAEDKKTWLVGKRFSLVPGSAADLAEPKFHNGDKIVKIDDAIIDDYSQINREMIQKADRKLTVVVERAEVGADGKPSENVQRIAIPVKPNPMRHLGLALKMSKISAVQKDSPAAQAGIKAGDRLLSPTADDPMKLPQLFNRQAGKTVELKIRSPGEKQPRSVPVKLREPLEYYPSNEASSPVQIDISSLGITVELDNEVDRVLAGSPAALAGLQPGDLIIKAVVNPSEKEEIKEIEYPQSEATVEFIPEDKKGRNWPVLIYYLQLAPPGTTVNLTFMRHDKEITVKGLDLIEAADWFNPDRGLRFEQMVYERKAKSIADAIVLGGRETLDNLTIVFRTVKGLSTNQISMKLIGGPWMILKVALYKADEGNAAFLLFLTMLSANLAVLNFLPIPVLDGGHFVLLAYEGIRGKPANENVQTVLAYIGLFLILALMIWACSLDFNLIKRW